MDAQAIIQSYGPLPLKQAFSAPADGPVVFFISGSAWSSSANSWIGISVQLDGTEIGTASVYCNEVASHRALISNLVTVNLSFGNHTISITPTTPNTNTDQNDAFFVTLMY
ncbi:MAG: hypothetical protein ACREBG_06460 [Pyrinomonadaceae bacterium]